MKPSITARPFFQNAGSDASSPNGASSSLCRLRAAGAQHVEIFLRETLMRALKDRVERVHQAIAERIGIDIERRVDEVRDVGPEHAVFVLEAERGPEAFALHLEPDLADPLGRQLAGAALVVDAGLERRRTRSGAPPCSACPRPCAPACFAALPPRSRASSMARKVSISPNTQAVSASVSGVSAIR